MVYTELYALLYEISPILWRQYIFTKYKKRTLDSMSLDQLIEFREMLKKKDGTISKKG